ncbi:MAG: hypothetical protein IJ105_00645 [Bacilli bacterium]|nr:hypothetical protein [Bacilli bacterium]
MSKNKRKGKKKIRRIVLFVIVLIIAGVLVFMALNNSNNKQTDVKKKKVVDKIDDFDYSVSETDTKLFKDEFKKLKTELSKDEVDNKKYSELVAKLFIIDFFTLDNKMTKNDVGGVQFVYSKYKTSFIDKARDEFYKYLKNNLDGKRNQDLPKVSKITVESSEEVNASSELSGSDFSSIDQAYKVNLSWEYEEDLGYQKNATVIVVKDDDKFSVAKLSN